MRPSQPARTSSPPRILVVSERAVEHHLAFTAWAEAEDVLLAHSDAQLLRLSRRSDDPVVRARRLAGRTLRARRGAERLLPTLGGGDPPAFDVAVAVAKSVWSLPLLEAEPAVRRADTVVGWFPEVWPSQVTPRLALEPFALLDTIFVGEPRSAAALARLLDRDVHYLPLATDAERFSGGATPDDVAGRARPVDVLNIGRREAGLHDGLLQWARTHDAYYRFDTLTAATAQDGPLHRWALAGDLLHTNVAITSYAKQGMTEVVGDLRWVPSRVFDSLAAGTLLAGVAPDPDAQKELFGREVVHPLPEHDPATAVDRVADLVASGTREQRADNVATTLRGHDWSHRWVTLLEQSGLVTDPRLAARATRLTRAGSRPQQGAPEGRAPARDDPAADASATANGERSGSGLSDG